MLTKEKINVVKRVRDCFGQGTLIGGSFAVSQALGSNRMGTRSDVDFYIPNRGITTEAIESIIANLVFKNIDNSNIHFLPRAHNPGYYKIKGMVKRIPIYIAHSEQYFDFIFVNDLSPETLIKYQASNLTKCVLELNFASTPWKVIKSEGFITGHRDKLLHINAHESICTQKHYEKMVNRYPDYKLLTYYQPVEK